jgi:hypothetical protein
MRDKNRIYPICVGLAQAWENTPDLRLGQIMSNISEILKRKGKDIFYVEDDELLEMLKEYLSNS